MTSTSLATPRTAVTTALLAAMRLAVSRPAGSVEDLTALLYEDWYLRADRTRDVRTLGLPTPVEVDPVAALRAAHADDGRFESGWVAERLSTRGRVLVRKAGRHRILDRIDCFPLERPLLPPRPGTEVAVAVRHDLVDEAGFWHTFLPGWDPDRPPDDMVRIYWAVQRTAAPDLVHALTAQLATAVPAALKVGTSPLLLGRPDAAVLYLPTGSVPDVLPVVRDVAAALAKQLGGRTPPLALPVAHGVALAEDPGGDTSFGEHRCRVLARAATELSGGAVPGSVPGDAVLLAAARQGLADAGIDPIRPHRRIGSRLEEEL